MHERAHVVDVDSQEGLETKSVNHIGLVYSSATFKSIATGGNVSKALVRWFAEKKLVVCGCLLENLKGFG